MVKADSKARIIHPAFLNFIINFSCNSSLFSHLLRKLTFELIYGIIIIKDYFDNSASLATTATRETANLNSRASINISERLRAPRTIGMQCTEQHMHYLNCPNERKRQRDISTKVCSRRSSGLEHIYTN